MKTRFSVRFRSDRRVGCVGSILHLLPHNSDVLGCGWNGKINLTEEIKQKLKNLDIYGLRGPLTKKFLIDNVPDIKFSDQLFFGDPAILISEILPKKVGQVGDGRSIWLPNLNEINRPYSSDLKFVSPYSHWRSVVQQICSAKSIVTSSLHGLIIGEVYGKDVRLVLPSKSETQFKYIDYLQGTGRSDYQTLDHAIELEEIITPNSGMQFSKPVLPTENLIAGFEFYFREKNRNIK